MPRAGIEAPPLLSKLSRARGASARSPNTGCQQGMTPFLLCHRLFKIGLLLFSVSSSRPPHPVICLQSVSPTVPRTVMVVTDSNGTE